MKDNCTATTVAHNSIVEEKKESFTHKPWQRAKNAEAIAKGIDIIPENWVLTSLINKKPIRDDWNIEPPLERSFVKELILKGDSAINSKGDIYQRFWSGFGIRTGEISGGILCIDEDGETPAKILQKIVEVFDKDGLGLPKTLCWTSGKPGRKQSAYQIPDNYREAFKPIAKIVLHSFDGISSNDPLEFRYGHINQSALPPSIHPETGCYKWINSPTDCEVAILPEWICDFIITEWNSKIENVKTKIPKAQAEESTLRYFFHDKIVPALLEKFTINEIFNLADHNFVRVGDQWKGKPIGRHSSTGQSFHVFFDDEGILSWVDQNSSEPDAKNGKIGGDLINYFWRYEYGKSGTPTGHHFVRIVQNLAFKAGVDMPDYNPKKNESENKEESQSNSENSVFKKTGECSITKIKDVIKQILSSGCLISQESEKLSHLHFRLQKEFKFTSKLFNDLVNSVRKDLGHIDSLEQKRLNHLLEAGKAELNLFDIFPKTLAEAIEKEAKIKNIEPIILIQLLFPAISSLVGNKVNLRINSHKVPAIIWSAIVGAPSVGKSRGADSIIDPISKLQSKSLEKLAEEKQAYEDKMLDYQEEYDSLVGKNKVHHEIKRLLENQGLIYDEATKSELLGFARENGYLQKPEEPKARTYLFDDSTVSSVLNTLVSNPNHSGLWYTDEILSIFDSLGQYSKSSKSNDRPRLIKLWDGKDITITRVATESKTSNGSALSLTGGIQPGVFRKAFRDIDDSDGLQARFLFASAKRLDSHESLDFAELAEKLTHFYNFLDSIPNLEIRFSKEAYEMYWQIKKKEDEWFKKASSSAMQNWIGKFNSHVSRLAIAFHLIERYYKGDSVNLDDKIEENGKQYGLSLEISALTMQRALTLGLFYKKSLEYLLGTVADSDDEHLILLQIQELAKTFDEGISVRDIYRKIKGIERYAELEEQKPAMVAETFIKKLEKYGYGSVVKKGKSLFYQAFDKVLDMNLEESNKDSVNIDEIDVLKLDIYEDEEKVIPITINQKQIVQEISEVIETSEVVKTVEQAIETVQEQIEQPKEMIPERLEKDLTDPDNDGCKYLIKHRPLENLKAWIGIRGCYEKDNKRYFLIDIKPNKKLLIQRISNNGIKTIECNIEEFEIYDNELSEIEEFAEAC
jgi:hypothetical protein